jgi:hypothetical protein
MPKLLRARAPQDTAEEQKVRKLAYSRHAPGDCIYSPFATLLLRSYLVAPPRDFEDAARIDGALQTTHDVG